ncbi:glycopeptide resistance-associated protein GraF [Staphylococcus epidermidis]
MTNKEFEKKSAEKAKEVEGKLKEQNEEKTDDIEQTKKDIQDTLD